MDLYVNLSRGSNVPLHVQIEQGVRAAIRSGRLRVDLELPSTRQLATELGVSRGVVVEAYAQLRAEGYLTIAGRGKTLIAPVATASDPSPSPSEPAPPPVDYDFHPGNPDLAGFPRANWARALRGAVTDLPAPALAYGDLQGAPPLREALASHLSRARGAVAGTDGVLVTQGFTEGLALVCKVLAGRGAARIAMEDPCLPIHRLIAADAGLEPVAIPVDSDGIDIEALERAAVDAVLVTPAHQFPLGVVLAPERRARLIDWARERGAYIVEDDYDAEYRYDRDPVGALQGLAPERIIYGGSASKTLVPSLRLGWLLLPKDLLGATLERKAYAGASPIVDQLALATWLDRGDFHRHLRRMRLRYRGRREAMIAALRRHLPGARLQGIAAGLHVLASLPDGTNENQLAIAVRRRGVSVHPLSWHRADPASGPPGLVLGYANLAAPSIERGIAILGQCVREEEIA